MSGLFTSLPAAKHDKSNNTTAAATTTAAKKTKLVMSFKPNTMALKKTKANNDKSKIPPVASTSASSTSSKSVKEKIGKSDNQGDTTSGLLSFLSDPEPPTTTTVNNLDSQGTATSGFLSFLSDPDPTPPLIDSEMEKEGDKRKRENSIDSVVPEEGKPPSSGDGEGHSKLHAFSSSESDSESSSSSSDLDSDKNPKLNSYPLNTKSNNHHDKIIIINSIYNPSEPNDFLSYVAALRCHDDDVKKMKLKRAVEVLVERQRESEGEGKTSQLEVISMKTKTRDSVGDSGSRGRGRGRGRGVNNQPAWMAKQNIGQTSNNSTDDNLNTVKGNNENFNDDDDDDDEEEIANKRQIILTNIISPDDKPEDDDELLNEISDELTLKYGELADIRIVNTTKTDTNEPDVGERERQVSIMFKYKSGIEKGMKGLKGRVFSGRVVGVRVIE